LDEEANNSKVLYLHGKVCGIYGRYKRDRIASYPGRSANPLAAGTRGILSWSNFDGNIKLSLQKSAEAIVGRTRAVPTRDRNRGLTKG
jgi:hypothetical protein